jgi:hypothetical protein
MNTPVLAARVRVLCEDCAGKELTMLIDSVTAPGERDNGMLQGNDTTLEDTGSAEMTMTTLDVDVVADIIANVDPSATPNTESETMHCLSK